MISSFSDILPVYSCSKLKLAYNLSFYHNACLKRDETCWCVQLLKLLSQNVSIMFDCEKFWASSITELNRSQSNDRSSIGFDYRRSIDHARGMKAQLNSKITPVTCHSKFCFNERSSQFHVLLVVKEHQKPLNCQLITYYRFQVQQSHKQSTLSATSVDKVRLT